MPAPAAQFFEVEVGGRSIGYAEQTESGSWKALVGPYPNARSFGIFGRPAEARAAIVAESERRESARASRYGTRAHPDIERTRSPIRLS